MKKLKKLFLNQLFDDALLLQKDGTVYLDFDRESTLIERGLEISYCRCRAGWLIWWHHYRASRIYFTMAEAARYFVEVRNLYEKLSSW